jgi:hypothetical protein
MLISGRSSCGSPAPRLRAGKRVLEGVQGGRGRARALERLAHPFAPVAVALEVAVLVDDSRAVAAVGKEGDLDFGGVIGVGVVSPCSQPPDTFARVFEPGARVPKGRRFESLGVGDRAVNRRDPRATLAWIDETEAALAQELSSSLGP